MAEVVSTIIQSGGGDYTSISAWEAATNLNGGTDIWHGVISDNAAYDEAVIIDGGGTNNTSSYVKLSVATANRHAGKWDTGKARLSYSGADTAVVELDTNYVMVEGLQVFRPSTGSIGNSDEGIRVASGASDGCLISRCLIWTDNHTNSPDTDGIYLGNWAINSLYLDHCIVYGWERAGLHMQQFNNSGGNQTVVIDYSTFAFCGNAGSEAPISIRQENGATSVTVWNTVLRHHQDRVWADLGIDDGGSGDSVTIEGGNNTYGTIAQSGSGTTAFNWVNNNVHSSSSIVDTDTAGDIIVVDATSNPVTAATDLTLQDLANNVALLTGTNRIGSEPDPRQDFSVDLAGNTRSATSVDPGPLQVSAVGSIGDPFPHVSVDFGAGLVVPSDIEVDFGAGLVRPTTVVFVVPVDSSGAKKLLMVVG